MATETEIKTLIDLLNQDETMLPQNLLSLARTAKSGQLQALSDDSLVPFECNPFCPGLCCTESTVESILISPWDAWRLSKGGIPIHSNLFETHAGPNSGIPVLTIKPTEPRAFEIMDNRGHLVMSSNGTRFCPFHKPDPNGNCGIYQFRPSACRLYPLGRAWVGRQTADNQSVLLDHMDCIYLFPGTPDCPVPITPSNPPTCKRFLKSQGLTKLDDKMAHVGMKAIANLSLAIHNNTLSIKGGKNANLSIFALLFASETLRRSDSYALLTNNAALLTAARSDDDETAFPAAMEIAVMFLTGKTAEDNR